MIQFSNNIASILPTLATFTDNGNTIHQYTNDRNYYEDLVGKWGHLSNLVFTNVIPTDAQTDRLDILNNIEADYKENWGAECSMFVEHGIIIPDTDCPFLQPLVNDYLEATLSHFRELRREELKAQRDEVVDSAINNVQVGRITDRENIQGTLANWDVLGLGDSINWTMADNTVQALSKEDLQAIYVGYATRKAQCFALYEQAILALHNANTIEDIMNVNFNSPQ